jgi:hypothetical protein
MITLEQAIDNCRMRLSQLPTYSNEWYVVHKTQAKLVAVWLKKGNKLRAVK